MTRLFYDYFMGKDKLLNLTFSSKISKNLMANVHFDFMGRNKLWLTITGAAVVVCIAFLATRGLSQSIDFTGGRNFKVQFENPVEPEQVRELIASKFGDANVSVIAIGTDRKQYVSAQTTASKMQVTTWTQKLNHTCMKL